MNRMRCVLALSLLLPAGAAAANCGSHGTRQSLFVSTAWLSDHLKDGNLALLAVGDEKDYNEGHIPGSVWVDYHKTHDMHSAGGLSTELLPAADLARYLATLGIRNDSRIVLYYLKDWFTPAGRIYMTLDEAGLGAQASLLDGGFAAWKKENRPVTTEAPKVVPGQLSLCERDDVVAGLDYVKTHLHTPGVRIVDARDPKVFSGENERAGISAGHIEGAANIYYNSLLDESGKLKPVSELQHLFTAAGVKPGDRVVTYCFIGQQASALYTVARYLGYDARLYDGSMDEWTKHPELPVENPARKK